MIRSTAEAKREVREALAFWRPITGMDRWTILVQWQAAPDRDDVPAGVTAAPEYLTGTLYVNLPLLLQSPEYSRSPKHVSWLILHELCHFLSWEMAVNLVEPMAITEVFRRTNERMTCMIARAIWVARFRREPPE